MFKEALKAADPVHAILRNVSVAGGKLHAPGVEPIDVPEGAWLHVEMECGFGPQATGTWTLAVTLPGEEPLRLEGLEHRHGKLEKLDWLGFSSTADHPTAFYLDNIELENTKATAGKPAR